MASKWYFVVQSLSNGSTSSSTMQIGPFDSKEDAENIRNQMGGSVRTTVWEVKE
jgi:nitrous oxide reductase accessory protein NosL